MMDKGNEMTSRTAAINQSQGCKTNEASKGNDETLTRNRGLWKEVAHCFDWLSFICLGAGLVIGTFLVLVVIPLHQPK